MSCFLVFAAALLLAWQDPSAPAPEPAPVTASEPADAPPPADAVPAPADAVPSPADAVQPEEDQAPVDTSPPAPVHDLLTVAERSNWTATARHAEVLELVDALVARSPFARRASLGTSVEGRDLPLLIFADPPVADAAEARAAVDQGKLLVFVFANIHAGEVCGKEALLMLARQLVLDPEHPDVRPLLDELVLVFAPIFNADGNERMDPGNRPGQLGPVDGMGTRANAQGLDLNRDYVKLESPEVRAMVAFLNEWDPTLVIDCHTTNGSLHRYHLTYSAPLNPTGPTVPLETVRDMLLPEVSRRLEARTGFRSFPYGNFEDGDVAGEHVAWATYSAMPRFGAQYHGLRGNLSILSEAYSKASYRERVEVTREFVRECLLYAVRHASRLRAAVASGRAQVRMLGRRAEDQDRVGLRHTLAPAPGPAEVLGWVETTGPDGETLSTGQPKLWSVEHLDRFAATLEVTRPRAYLIPPALGGVVDRLLMHGIEVRRAGELVASRASLAPDMLTRPLPVEVWRVDAVTRAAEPFEGHELVSLEATLETVEVPFDPDWWVVSLDQDRGSLAAYLLEPLSEDGFVTWNLFDDQLTVGELFPVLRLMQRPDWLPRF